jgi:hypothetical protein
MCADYSYIRVTHAHTHRSSNRLGHTNSGAGMPPVIYEDWLVSYRVAQLPLPLKLQRDGLTPFPSIDQMHYRYAVHAIGCICRVLAIVVFLCEVLPCLTKVLLQAVRHTLVLPAAMTIYPSSYVVVACSVKRDVPFCRVFSKVVCFYSLLAICFRT